VFSVNEEGKEEVVSVKETEPSKPPYNFDSHSKSCNSCHPILALFVYLVSLIF
jgi:hypothetical protein